MSFHVIVSHKYEKVANLQKKSHDTSDNCQRFHTTTLQSPKESEKIQEHSSPAGLN